MITVDSKIKEIRKYPDAVAIINEAMKEASDDYMAVPSLKRADNMTLRALAGFPMAGITPEIFAVIEEKLEEAEIEEEDEDD